MGAHRRYSLQPVSERRQCCLFNAPPSGNDGRRNHTPKKRVGYADLSFLRHRPGDRRIPARKSRLYSGRGLSATTTHDSEYRAGDFPPNAYRDGGPTNDRWQPTPALVRLRPGRLLGKRSLLVSFCVCS